MASVAVGKPDGDILHAVLRVADADIHLVRVALAHAVAQPRLLTWQSVALAGLHRVHLRRLGPLEEVGGQPGRRGRVVAREAEEVDRRHRQEGGVTEEVGVVLHLRRRDQQLARPAPLEEAQRVIWRYQTVALSVDEEGGAGNVGDDLAVGEALVEGPRYKPSNDALHSRLYRGEGGHEDEAPHGVLRREVDGWPAAQGAAEEDDLRVPHADLVDQEAKRR
mmetsp:Transcript_6696/g.17067  ORF Transcript_6696/g.17067 Transcript_6696/m.17067 type:complete len:221 (-) Transcript_6696:483-1145(-)